ncbi:Extensin protein-like, partial [Mycolicibacterium hippocampi]|nr:Extensin protein-like [Mycolicibacterium hippocampi]
MRETWRVVIAGLFVGAVLSPVLGTAPTAHAVCGSVGGVHFDVTGCSDPLYELNDVLAPPPPP